MTSKFEIPPSEVPKIREWFRLRGGVLRWSNLEIGYNRPDMLTPAATPAGNKAEVYGKPHWAMGNPRLITPDEIEIVDEQTVPIPESLQRKWFAPCDKCRGAGKRSIAELASIRQQSVDECLRQIEAGEIHIVGNHDAESFDCNYCGGTGAANRATFYVSIRRKYWGMDITDTGRLRADRYARMIGKELGQSIQWTWDYDGYGRAKLRFYVETRTPFILE